MFYVSLFFHCNVLIFMLATYNWVICSCYLLQNNTCQIKTGTRFRRILSKDCNNGQNMGPSIRPWNKGSNNGEKTFQLTNDVGWWITYKLGFPKHTVLCFCFMKDKKLFFTTKILRIYSKNNRCSSLLICIVVSTNICFNTPNFALQLRDYFNLR